MHALEKIPYIGLIENEESTAVWLFRLGLEDQGRKLDIPKHVIALVSFAPSWSGSVVHTVIDWFPFVAFGYGYSTHVEQPSARDKSRGRRASG